MSLADSEHDLETVGWVGDASTGFVRLIDQTLLPTEFRRIDGGLLVQQRDLMVAGQQLILTLDVETRNDEVRLTCQGIELLEKAVENAAAGLRILMGSGEGVPGLRDALARESRGRGQISIIVSEPEREIELKLPGAWVISGKCRAAIKSLPGVVEVQEI